MRPRTLKISLILFLALVLLSQGGCAPPKRGKTFGQAPPPREALLENWDHDRDGRLSREEFPGPDHHFSKFDRNDDGFLDKDELPQGPPPFRV